MARQNLTKLIDQLDTNESPTPTRPPVVALERSLDLEQDSKQAAPASPTAAPRSAPKQKPVQARRQSTRPSRNFEDGTYTELERKETRLRADQYEALSLTARRLQKQKVEPGKRITENTLIRVAIDLLLEHRDELAGETEEAIRNSVSL